MTKAENPKQTVAVIGAGTMGHGVAQVFAVAGFPVRLYDSVPEALASALKRVRENLAAFLEAGLIKEDQIPACLDHISLYDNLEQACRGADLVIEAAPENLELKQRLFAEMEGYVSADAILCTNTSALRITGIGALLKRPERLVGAHFWNPPHVMPCVEVIKGDATDEAVFESTVELMRAVGKDPVRVRKDIPGFLGNRLQHAIQREALALIEKGVCDPEDIDRVVKSGFGLRYAFMGPVERADIGGLDVTFSVQKTVLPDLDNRTDPSPLLAEKVARGELGVKTGKGFYEWPERKAAAMKQKRDRIFLSILKLLRENK